jgi:uncharacterized protein YbjT (DUF2867 family)
MKAFVAGATGQTGRRIVEELVKRQIPVRAMVRNREAAQEILPKEVELVVGDVLKPAGLTDLIGNSTVLLCATGAKPSFDITAPYSVDYLGTKNLTDAAKAKNLEQFVLVSSLCVSKFFHPLNLFWLILYWKLQGENYLRSSGLTYTIVRPGGLKNENNADSVVLSSADTLFDGSIPRQKVAEICVEALFYPSAQNKVIETIAQPEAPAQDWSTLFSSVA